ncbi:MAG TPA: prephenate dehydratase [Saprospiraceae bacterium]|nr:prephenate dehydratase [Saprospiraceae bacterium]HNM25246.1 prephenate dehydratase [Saprospiraceae bacterium]
MSTLPSTPPMPSPARGAMRVVIQGVRGAFHEIAARQFFNGPVEVVPAATFAELIRLAGQAAQTDAAVMAIENSIAGSILGNYKLLQTSDLAITGEIFLPIRQNLLALPGVQAGDIREVHSHPMALAQCADFFRQYPHWQLVETDDTAAAAARIARDRRNDMAAVGSALAAELYGLTVLASGIETHEANFTRFLVLERRETVASTAPNGSMSRRKISVCFSVPHRSGSLSRILTVLAGQSANLTKIQSVPIVGRVGEYLFFVDFTLENPAVIPETLRLLDVMTQACQVLGIYKPGELA